MIKKILLIIAAFTLSALLLSGCTGDETSGNVTTHNTTVSTTEATTESTTESSVTTTDGVGDWTGSDTTDISDVTGTETPTEGIGGSENSDAGEDALNGDNTNGNGLSDGM